MRSSAAVEGPASSAAGSGKAGLAPAKGSARLLLLLGTRELGLVGLSHGCGASSLEGCVTWNT